MDGECLPLNSRAGGNYCTVKGVWLPQKELREFCKNNFECISNFCVSGRCSERIGQTPEIINNNEVSEESTNDVLQLPEEQSEKSFKDLTLRDLIDFFRDLF